MAADENVQNDDKRNLGQILISPSWTARAFGSLLFHSQLRFTGGYFQHGKRMCELGTRSDETSVQLFVPCDISKLTSGVLFLLFTTHHFLHIDGCTVLIRVTVPGFYSQKEFQASGGRWQLSEENYTLSV